jgi:hypothetical protein
VGALRNIFGFVAVAALATALNVAVWAPDPLWLLVLGVITAVAGLLWLAMAIAAAGRGTTLQGRAVGGLKAVADSFFFTGICILVYLFASYPAASWDLSREGRRDLAPQTVQVLENMTEEVEVLCFFVDIQNDLVQIAKEKTLRFLEQCQTYTGLLDVRLIDPQIDRVSLQEMGVTHLSPQGTVVVKAGGRQKVIWFSGGSPRLEEADFTNALINVLRATQPVVGYLTGHGERRIEDDHETEGASLVGQFLASESYQPAPIAVPASNPEVPPDTDVIVVHRPQSDFTAAELDAFDEFMARGGRMLVLLEPWSLIRSTGAAEKLRGWLETRYGITVPGDIVVRMPEARGLLEREANPLQVALTADPGPFAELAEPPDDFRGCYTLKHPITRTFDQQMLLSAASTVTPAAKKPAGVTVTTLLRTPPPFWADTDVRDASLQDFDPKPDPREARGPLPLAVAATIKTGVEVGDTGQMREGRLVVVGHERFASNAELASGPGGHLNFFLNTMAWLTENESIIALRPEGASNPPLVLDSGQQRLVTWVTMLLTLQGSLAAGALAWLARRGNR